MSRTDAWLLIAPPLLWLMLDRLTMGLIDQHLLSMRVLAAIPILPGIISEAASGFWKTLAIELSIWFLICLVIGWVVGRLKTKPLDRKCMAAGACLVWLVALWPSIADWDQAAPQADSRSEVVLALPDQRDQRIGRIRFAHVNDVSVSANLPDIIIIVLESFRHELVDPEVMPNLTAAAENGLWCKHHFSSGNATSHGMFSIVTGMDANWFNTALRYQPPLTRLLKSAGYELGFFAGHDDWRTFYMDGFVSAEHFDAFEITPQKGLHSDRQAIQSTMIFLEPDESRSPRLAILYLYVTHAPYRSDAQDRIFSPAAKDGFSIPYPKDQTKQVWNRYKNSARTADRWIGSIMASSANRIVLVTGDHGESFLEDGTIGHGSKISTQQNQTPAILIGPGVPRRQISEPTIHSDLLPTLLAATGIELSDSGRPKKSDQPLFDGYNLLNTNADELSRRTNVTRDYLTERIRLITEF